MVMVVDDATAITGSFHFRAAAQKGNAENLLVLNDRELADQYLANWACQRAASVTYVAADIPPGRSK
jgi:phospholipase D